MISNVYVIVVLRLVSVFLSSIFYFKTRFTSGRNKGFGFLFKERVRTLYDGQKKTRASQIAQDPNKDTNGVGG